MFNKHDRDYFSKSLREAHQQLGQKLTILVPTPDEEENIYEEDKYLTYHKVDVIGMILSNPTAEQLTPVGLDKRASVVISIESNTLSESGVIISPIEELYKCKLVVGEETYTVLNVIPCNLVQGVPLVYKFESGCE